MTTDQDTAEIRAVRDPREAEPAPEPARRRARPARGALALTLLAAVPLVAVVVEALTSPRLNFFDYWTILTYATHPDGTLDPAGLFTVYNSHPMVLAGLLFWLDATLFGGSNNVLGLVAAALALAVVLSLRSMLPRELGATKRAALTAAFSFLVFSTNAMEYFGFGMSGVHWLSGLAPAAVAIALAHRGHTVPATLLALVACLGHGSAFPVWLGLVVVAWLRRDRPWRVVVPLAAGIAAMAAYLVRAAGFETYEPGYPIRLDDYLSTAAQVLGQPFSGSGNNALAATLGIAVAVAALTLAGVVARRRADAEPGSPLSGWAGLAAFGVASAALVGWSRAKFGADTGASARYSMLAVLTICAALTLAVLLRPALAATAVVVAALVLGVGTYAAGNEKAVGVRSYYAGQETLTLALWTGAQGAIEPWQFNLEALPRMRALGMYPFADAPALGCAGYRLGDAVPAGAVKPLPAKPEVTTAAGFVDTEVRGDSVMKGWAVMHNRAADCVLVLDDAGVVTGAGTTGIIRKDVAVLMNTQEQRAGWVAVSRPAPGTPSVVVAADGELYRISPGAGPGN